jgi:tetratricopeptide (TPR) repeat protein
VRFGAYRECIESTTAFDRWAERHGTRLVVLGLQPHAPIQLFRHLEADPAWRLVSFDAAGAVFAADSLAASRGLERIALDRPLHAIDAPVGRTTRSWQECDPGPAGSRGALLLRLGYPRAAVEDLSRAFVGCPRRMDVGVQLAIALVGDGRAPSARPLVEQALARDPADLEAWLAAGLVQRALGDAAGAREAWAHAAALAPNDPRPSRYLRALDLAPPP